MTGGEDAAIETALQLADSGHCASVTLMHRNVQVQRPSLCARSGPAANAGEMAGSGVEDAGQPAGIETSEDSSRLLALEIATGDDSR